MDMDGLSSHNQASYVVLITYFCWPIKHQCLDPLIRIVSHSATSDMHSIDQESPTNGSNPYKLDRYMSRGQKDDDFEIVDNIRSLQIK